MAVRDDVRSWYLRQHMNSSTPAAVAPANNPVRKESRNGGGVDAVLQELLASNPKTAGNIAGTIENRLLDRPYLLDNPATHGGASERAKERALRARSKRSTKHFSMRQHRHTGSFRLPEEYHKYALFLPMHEMWQTYARSLVKDCNEAMLQPRLLSADLHGAILAVVESKSISHVGTQGIMVRETDQTFGIITLQDKFRLVPKAGAVFMFQLDSLRITLLGNNLFSRQLHPRKQRQLKPTIAL